ncbi:hypothetical protein Glove_82g9 [Diversispora epigaea]|uniref:Uncharacterized protein n=1 Tax=Diversispora epigaea TaxID=1348612 RepID=A0A397JBB3_9GLOM|nr:hypothetical protein Glove_82g9 [Diversispora epigaea]
MLVELLFFQYGICFVLSIDAKLKLEEFGSKKIVANAERSLYVLPKSQIIWDLGRQNAQITSIWDLGFGISAFGILAFGFRIWVAGIAFTTKYFFIFKKFDP